MDWISNKIVNTSEYWVIKLDLKNRKIKYNNKIQFHRSINTKKGGEDIVVIFLVNRLVNDLGYKP